MVAKCRCADWLSDTVAQLETQARAGGRRNAAAHCALAAGTHVG
jgi:hypothetical protein